jgi:hypothetical protein
MRARPDLDIDELLLHYGTFIRGGSRPFYVLPPEEDESARSYAQDGQLISRIGWGPETCSSSTVLDISPRLIWDVNSWYRDLGVAPEASRKEMRLAYLERGGPDSGRLTYILKCLCDTAKRRRYDRMPLGSLFMEDALVQEVLKRQAAATASRMAGEGNPKTADEVLSDMGYERHAASESPEDASGDEQRPPDPPWPYSWFRRRAQSADSADFMEAWQHHLVSELASRGRRIYFAVGVFEGPARAAAEWHDGRLIFFLRVYEIPSRGTAMHAVEEFLRSGT